MGKKTLAPVQAREMELIEHHLEHLRRLGRSDATIRGRREILMRLDRDLPHGIGVASTEDLAQWLFRDRYGRNTKATYYAAMKTFYAWATDPRDPWLTFNPVDGLEKCTRVRGTARPVTDEELAKILHEAAEPFRTWALIAAYQGLRAIEISRLDREHITEQQLLVVRGKGNRPRAHDTHPDVWAAVKDLPPGPIARTADGERADEFYVSIQTAQHFRYALKMPKVGLHRLRHWLGVTVQRQYRDIRVTMALLGHVSLSSTQVYTAASDEQQRAARATLPRLAG
jgi:integrase/recombinase XerC